MQVTVDGDRFRHVVAYDVSQGWVEHIEHDERGWLVHRDGEWVIRRVHGKVFVTLMPEEGSAQ